MKGVRFMHNIKSKIFAAFLSFAIALSLAPAITSRADSKCGDNAYYKVEGSTVTISGTGAMWDYEDPIGVDIEEGQPAPWLWEDSDRDAIKSVVIEEGITYIGESTFSHCQYLKNVSLPKSLKKIGCAAFFCSGLESITIPDSVTTIENLAFFETNIKSLYIPQNVTFIGQEAFSCCYDLTSVTGGKGLKTIRAGAFSRCAELITFKITSKKLKKIGSSTFYADKKLKTLYLKKTTKLTKAGVKKSLRGSSVKKIKVKKSKIRKYRKIFKKSNSGRRVRITK